LRRQISPSIRIIEEGRDHKAVQGSGVGGGRWEVRRKINAQTNLLTLWRDCRDCERRRSSTGRRSEGERVFLCQWSDARWKGGVGERNLWEVSKHPLCFQKPHAVKSVHFQEMLSDGGAFGSKVRKVDKLSSAVSVNRELKLQLIHKILIDKMSSKIQWEASQESLSWEDFSEISEDALGIFFGMTCMQEQFMKSLPWSDSRLKEPCMLSPALLNDQEEVVEEEWDQTWERR
jgi:hypothetical protein